MATAVSSVGIQVSASSLYSPSQTEKAIAEIFGADTLVKLLSRENPSLADKLVHQDASQKSYYELASGRVVEVLTLKGGRELCIGSFTYTEEECCREGWATYHTGTDKQWCELETNFIQTRGEPDFTQDLAENWSCGWNCLQNYLYVQTGKKHTVLELMHYFIETAEKKIGKTFEALSSAKNRDECSEIIGQAIPDILSISSFFDEEIRFSNNDLIGQLLLGESKSATCEEGEHENGIYYSPKEFAEVLIKTAGADQSAILRLNHMEGHLLYSNPSGRLILIDPHNWKRSPNFESHRFVQEIVAAENSITLKTQHLSGQIQSYRRCLFAVGLGNDRNLTPLMEQLAKVQANGPIDVQIISKEMLALADTIEKCNSFFPDA